MLVWNRFINEYPFKTYFTLFCFQIVLGFRPKNLLAYSRTREKNNLRQHFLARRRFSHGFNRGGGGGQAFGVSKNLRIYLTHSCVQEETWRHKIIPPSNKHTPKNCENQCCGVEIILFWLCFPFFIFFICFFH